MAESYVQRRNLVNRGLREVRKALRAADTQLEILERHLDRLINRKTLVGPESLSRMIKDYTETVRRVEQVSRVMSASLGVATSYT